LDKYISKQLHLKVGALVIIVKNLSAVLVNGLAGEVVAMDTEGPTVHFKSIGKNIKIHKSDFYSFCCVTRQNKGTRSQIPLNLAYALTVHKAQGMTLDLVEVDCRHMTTPGQVGVAMGRAKCSSGLRVLNFTRAEQHPDLVEQFYSADYVDINLNNCPCPQKNMLFSENVEEIQELESVWDLQEMVFQDWECTDPNEENLSDDILTNLLDTAFDSAEVIQGDGDASHNHEANDEALLDIVSGDGSSVPEYFDIDPLLNSLLFPNPETDEQTQSNIVIKYLQENVLLVISFLRNMWGIIEENFKVAVSDKADAKNLRKFYSLLYQYQTSNQYIGFLYTLYGTVSLTPSQSNIGYKLFKNIREQYIKKVAEPKLSQSATNPAEQIVYDNSPGGLGKIRYIGG
jgi:hypothetical protein